MKIVDAVQDMADLASGYMRCGGRVGLVPTMGYLHEGHLSLVRESTTRCDVTVVSIFVNPTQFGKNEDFSAYPRDFERDCQLCESAGADVVFCPPASAMYLPDSSVSVIEETLSKGLCGVFRPGHFQGVCTVVAKLFHIVRPDVAVFGQKDAQQLAIIKRMVRDLNFPIEVVGVPIVRESDGLAMSSRNVYLSGDERGQALGLHRVLGYALSEIEGGLRDSSRLHMQMDAFLQRGYPGVQIEYIAFVDMETFFPQPVVCGDTLIALAARVGRTRLIDNVLVGFEGRNLVGFPYADEVFP